MGGENDRYKSDLQDGIRTAADMDRVPLTAEERAAITQVTDTFKVRVPKYYLDLIDWNDPDDPIRRQAIPFPEEMDWRPEELGDPVGDTTRSPVPRITHRYPDRVLLIPTYHCAVYCRHCFRKELVNDADAGFSKPVMEPAFQYIAERPEIVEAILTGGDPLVIPDDSLRYVRERLEQIPHLRLLRVHTRVPVSLPSRVTASMVAALKGRLMVCVVTHFNHPREITPEAAEACRLIREGGFMLLNQTVLLKGINDNEETLRTLFRDLVYVLGAKPYYLHHCDLTRGLISMRTTIEEGQELMRRLKGHISGVCIPQYSLDLPGGYGKVPLGPSYVREHDGRCWEFETYEGIRRSYAEVVEEKQSGNLVEVTTCRPKTIS